MTSPNDGLAALAQGIAKKLVVLDAAAEAHQADPLTDQVRATLAELVDYQGLKFSRPIGRALVIGMLLAREMSPEELGNWTPGLLGVCYAALS